MRFAKKVSYPAILAIPLIGGFVAVSWSNAEFTQPLQSPTAATPPAAETAKPREPQEAAVTPPAEAAATPRAEQQAALPQDNLPQDNLPRASALTLPAPGEIETSEEAAAAPPPTMVQITVAPGDTLMRLLVKSGADRQHAHEAVTAMEPVFSARRLRAGQEIELAFAALPESSTAQDTDALGPLLAVNFRPSLERDIEISRQSPEEDFSARAIDRPLARQLAFAQGVIDSNLSVAANAANVPNPILAEAIRAFSYDVDFQREIQKGDDFEFLYEIFVDEDGTLVRSGELMFAAMTLSGSRTELYYYERADGSADFYTPKGASVRRSLMRTPIDGARLSSGYGMRRHPILGYSRMHKGTDFAAPKGTPIYAAGNGVVEKAGRNGGYGKYIRIRHGASYKTAYAHLSRYAKGIKAGKRVKQGQVIGYVGSTGRSTGPHLHYEVILNGKQVNPLKVTLPRGDKLKKSEMADFAARRAEIDRQVTVAMGGILMVEKACEETQVVEQGSATDREC